MKALKSLWAILAPNHFNNPGYSGGKAHNSLSSRDLGRLLRDLGQPGNVGSSNLPRGLDSGLAAGRLVDSSLIWLWCPVSLRVACFVND